MIKIFAQKGNWGDGIELLVGKYVSSKLHYLFPENVVFTEAKDGERLEPSLFLMNTDAQVLMDNLWDCGLRPTNGSGSAGALLATQNHLKDLQKVLDRFLRVYDSTE